ncbi:MAG: hypothetical protein K8I27_08555 [Planctomycetes bacterium]|nr:hypothetical protein [Planctomycetota bacterium]
MLWEVMGLATRRERGKVAALEKSTNWKLENAQEDIGELQHEIEQLRLIVKSLASICQQKGVFTEAEYQDMQDFVDIQDGLLDGKSKPEYEPLTCPKCKRQNNHMAKSCMWCEAEI